MSGAPLKSFRQPWLARGLAVFCLAAACVRLSAADPIIITSSSKQFVVRGRTQTSMLSGSRSDTVYVDPSLLAVVCERVRDALAQELKWSKQWRDTIFINVYQASDTKAEPSLQALPAGPHGWRYRIDMPDELGRRQFFRPLIGALLLEYANRGSHDQSVELPAWVVEGMTEHLLQGALGGLALQPNTAVFRDRYGDDGGKALRASVQAAGALTVDQLSWPEFDARDTQAIEQYRASASLFVRELLHLRGGTDCFAAWLALLPENLNWQTAFLRAFDAHFTRMLDVEKWWSLVLVHARSREQAVAWSAAESQARLEEILYTPMQVRLSKEELPIVTPVSLQTLMSDWSFQDQEPILRGKINQLLVLRARVPQEFALLVNNYRSTIEKYLATRTSKNLARRAASAPAVKALLGAITSELGSLDQQRAALNARSMAASARPIASGEVPLTPH